MQTVKECYRFPETNQTLEVEVIPTPHPHFTDNKLKFQEVKEL